MSHLSSHQQQRLCHRSCVLYSGWIVHVFYFFLNLSAQWKINPFMARQQLSAVWRWQSRKLLLKYLYATVFKMSERQRPCGQLFLSISRKPSVCPKSCISPSFMELAQNRITPTHFLQLQNKLGCLRNGFSSVVPQMTLFFLMQCKLLFQNVHSKGQWAYDNYVLVWQA